VIKNKKLTTTSCDAFRAGQATLAETVFALSRWCELQDKGRLPCLPWFQRMVDTTHPPLKFFPNHRLLHFIGRCSLALPADYARIA
jgi:hypothetical protein